MNQVDKKRDTTFSIADSENELARARLAFGQGVQALTEAGTRAARRLVVPALWGAVLVGGAVAVFAIARLVRRRQREHALLRIVMEPARTERGLARTAGAALARLAVERLLSLAAAAAREKALTAGVSGERPGALGAEPLARLDSLGVQRNSTTNGRHETLG